MIAFETSSRVARARSPRRRVVTRTILTSPTFDVKGFWTPTHANPQFDAFLPTDSLVPENRAVRVSTDISTAPWTQQESLHAQHPSYSVRPSFGVSPVRSEE